MDVNKLITAKTIARVAHKDRLFGPVLWEKYLEAVADQVVQSFGEDTRLIDIAWLHDIFELTDIGKRHLRSFGVDKEVIYAVVLLTKTREVPYKDYINRLIKDKDEGSGLAWKVKVASTLTNLASSVISNEQERITKYSKQIILLYKGCSL